MSEYRVKNIVETLRRLPTPKHVGEVIKVPILIETWEAIEKMKGDNMSQRETLIFATAKRFCDNGGEHLEWVMDI